MITGKKYIKTLNGHTNHINEGEKYLVGIQIQPEDTARLVEIGFSPELEAGETLIPARFGRHTGFNFEGREEPIPGAEIQILYSTQYRKRMEFRGRDEREEVWDFVNIPYRYRPKRHIPSPSLHVVIESKDNKKYAIIDAEFVKQDDQDNNAILAVNMMLELFGRAELFSAKLEVYVKRPRISRFYNWEFIPPGDKPWTERLEEYKPFVDRVSKTKKPVVVNRIETIEKYQPDEVAFGAKGFQGYLVFKFSALGFYVFESMLHGNATYVVRGDWESVSKMTKSEIIQNSLHEYRFTHHDSWKKNIHELLEKNLLTTQRS
ncbi:hypothetical protein HN020_03095 [Brevibacillus borstelensis]|uniref:hypothetical protein n=1 Tax=Brevibacillus borstelensis TaxID=45462 RepID=UPI0014907FE7|nr:hypothetical protein [Brevibacillus borstelensis]MCM3593454.1 hypothetical protein [Brevibacillus borstelensis]NOU53786.1 hypothetical protein [Brevibacillus borstelensis]